MGVYPFNVNLPAKLSNAFVAHFTLEVIFDNYPLQLHVVTITAGAVMHLRFLSIGIGKE